VPEDLADRLHIRLAACLIAQGDGDSAYGEVEPLAKNDKHPHWPEAKFLIGEALIAQKKFAPAVEHLKMFRDHGPLQNVPGVSDRAMMRLGYAYEQLNQFDLARQAYEAHWNRYAQSPWRVEARYSIAWCLQKQNQHDAAVNTYNEVVKLTTSEVAARAQYNIGVCRFAQQRWQEAADAFQLCAYTYDQPELASQSLVDAAAALETLKKVPDAAKLLAQVGKDYPKSKAAVVAAERLLKLPVMQ
jgi:TolA-binding protein